MYVCVVFSLFISFFSFFLLFFFCRENSRKKYRSPRYFPFFPLLLFSFFFFIQLDKNVSSFFSFIRNHPYIGFQCQHLFEYFIFSFNFVWKTLFLANDLFVKLVNRFYILNRVDLSRQNSINDVEYELCIFLNAYPHKKKKRKIDTSLQLYRYMCERACVCMCMRARVKNIYIFFL